MRVLFLAALLALAAPLGPSGARAGGAPLVPVLRIDGRGFGHGVGLQEDGAFAMGESGASMPEILGQFYPGTELARVPDVPVRVVVLTTGPQATVSFPSGGQVQAGTGGAQPPGFPVPVPPGGEVTISTDGTTYTVTATGARGEAVASTASDERAGAQTPVRATLLADAHGTSGVGPALPTPASPAPVTRPTSPTTTTPPPSGESPGQSPTTTAPPASTSPTTTSPTTTPTTTAPTTTAPTAPPPSPQSAPAVSEAGEPLVALASGGGTLGVPETGRQYLGVLEAQALGPGQLELVNELPVEEYLQGMGEVLDPAWPPAALEAQAIVERTYALRAMETAGELCDTAQCQVYLGEQAAYPAMDAAIAATSGLVLVYDGQLAATVYSANGGGVTATPEEGFGTSDAPFPYLRAAPYETFDPDPWTVVMSLADAAARLSYPGVLEQVSVEQRGPSGRVLTLVLSGTAGPRTISGLAFAADLGLRSTLLVRVSVGFARGAAPPPPPPSPGQVLPTDRTAIAAAAAQPAPSPAPHDPSRGSRPPRGRPAGLPTSWWAAALATLLAAAGALGAWGRDRLAAFRSPVGLLEPAGRETAPGGPGAVVAHGARPRSLGRGPASRKRSG